MVATEFPRNTFSTQATFGLVNVSWAVERVPSQLPLLGSPGATCSPAGLWARGDSQAPALRSLAF